MKPEFDPTDSPLEALTASVQRWIPLQQSVDTLIDQASQSLQTSADQGKRQVRPESEQLQERPLSESPEISLERFSEVGQEASFSHLGVPTLAASAVPSQAFPLAMIPLTSAEPAIQQFQPNASQFYVKLKAVQEPDDSSSIV
jgi:hypothetical protein